MQRLKSSNGEADSHERDQQKRFDENAPSLWDDPLLWEGMLYPGGGRDISYKDKSKSAFNKELHIWV